MNNKLVFGLSCVITSVVSYALLTSAVTPVQTVNEYTSELTKASQGRQISVIAPAPNAQLMSGLGALFGLAALGSLWKLLEDSGLSDREPGTLPNSGSYHTPQTQSPSQPVSPLSIGNVPGLSPLMSSKLQPLCITGLVSTIGGQGSGKTTLNAAVLRERIAMGHRVIVINHHSAYREYEPLEVYGDGDTLEEQISHCEEGLQRLIDLREERYAIRKRVPENEWDFMSQPVTFLIEELGEYAGVVDEKLMNRFLKTVCAGVRKANIFVILSSQHDTMAMFGGTKGLAKLLQEGFVKITLENQPDASKPSGLGPTGRGYLSINGAQPVNVKIPDVSSMFPQGQSVYDFRDLFSSTNTQPGISLEMSQPETEQDTQHSLSLILERSLALPAFEPLSQDEATVLDIAQSSDCAVTARVIMLTNRVDKDADEIRMIFTRLSSLKYGSVIGKGKKLMFEAY